MSVKIKIFIGLMISAIILSPSFRKFLKNPALDQNRIPVKSKISNEKRNLSHHYPYGGTLVWGVANRPTVINPILTQTSVSAALLELIFDSLIRIDSNGKIIPCLASSWEISEDGKEYIFHLRKGILFHDGVELTSEDVKFTYDQIHDPINQSPWRSNTDLVEKWDVIDRYNIKLILKKTFVPALYKLNREIVPKHLLEGQDLNAASFNYSPIGTGPFKFKHWNRQTDQIELEENPDYFAGRAYLDKIIVKKYIDNSQLWSALMRHEVDLVQYINQENYLVLKKDSSFKTYSIDWRMYWAIAYNLQDSILAAPQVRKAIANGINKQEIINKLSEGGGIESIGPFYPHSVGRKAGSNLLEYNPVKARLQLLHRGWQDLDGDGILEKNGRRLKINLLVDSRVITNKKMAKMIRQQLAEIGINVEILLYDEEHDLTEKYLKEYHPQAWLRFFQGEGLDPSVVSESWYSLSSQIGKIWNYHNLDVDHLFEVGRSERDKNKRAEIYRKISEIVYNDQPACFLFFPTSLFAINSKFCNTEQYFSRHMPTYTIKDWYISNN